MKRNRLASLSAASLMALAAACATNDVEDEAVSALEGADEEPAVISLRDHQGSERTLVLQPQSVGDRANEASRVAVKSRENADVIYRDLYRMLAGTRFVRELRLPHPDSIADKDATYVRGYIKTIAMRADDIRKTVFPD